MKPVHHLNLSVLIRPNVHTPTPGWVLGKLIVESAVLAFICYLIVVLIMS